MPVCLVSGWTKSPPQKLPRVAETKHLVIILDIVQAQKVINLSDDILVLQVTQAPLELINQRIGLLPDFLCGLSFIDRALFLPSRSGLELGHRLRLPETVRLLWPAPVQAKIRQILFYAWHTTMTIVMLQRQHVSCHLVYTSIQLRLHNLQPGPEPPKNSPGECNKAGQVLEKSQCLVVAPLGKTGRDDLQNALKSKGSSVSKMARYATPVATDTAVMTANTGEWCCSERAPLHAQRKK